MRFSRVAIESLAYVAPPVEWTSEAIEAEIAPLYERLRLSPGRLELMTGIRARRFWDHPIRPSEASAQAGAKALETSRFGADEIDLIVHCGVCRDRLEPATASYVHRALGLSRSTQIGDVSNACLGFVSAMAMAGSMIESGQIRRALLVSGENGKPLVEHTLRTLREGDFTRQTIKPYFANLTIGAGAAAAVLSSVDEAPESPRLVGGAGATDSSQNELCEGDAAGADGLEMLTDSEALLHAGLNVAQEAWSAFQYATGWDAETPRRFLCHQVGRRHQLALLQALGIDPERDFPTYPEFGNVGSVSLPLTMAKALEAGAVVPGDKAALLGIGSGVTSLMLGIEIPLAKRMA